MKEAGIAANIVVATGATQVDSIYGQLGNDVDVVIEPERRDTFPAIFLAASYLYFTVNMHKYTIILISQFIWKEFEHESKQKTYISHFTVFLPGTIQNQ